VTRLLERRWPTLLVASICCGLALGSEARPDARSALLASGGLLGLSLVQRDATVRLAALAAVLLCAGLAFGSLRADALDASVLAARVGEASRASVVVTGPARRTPFSLRLPVEVRAFGAVTLRERALLELPRGRAPPRGAVLEIVRARLVAPRGPETGFDERGWLARRGIHVVLEAQAARVVGRRGGIGGVADRLRAHIESTLARSARGERLALLRGFVLGDDSLLEDDLRDAFRSSGLAHMTAVSGQNVAIVVGFAVAVAWLLGLGRAVMHVLAIVTILAYALAVGWEPSVVRAAVAGCVISAAWLASRPGDRWHALALGALVILVWSPAAALEPGFQLSFAAVAAILAVVGPAARWAGGYPVPEKLAVGVAVSAACSVATAPIAWLHFGRVSVWSVPANLAAEGAMPVVLLLSLAAAALGLVVPSAADTLVWVAGWATWWIASCARLFGSLPLAQVGSTGAVAAIGAALAAAAAFVHLPARERPRWLATGTAAACLLAAGWWWTHPPPSWVPPGGLRVTFLDVGQGDAVLVETRRASILVDQGPPEAQVAGQLRSLGVRRLSALVLTHPQRDHIGGAADVLRRIAVGAVLHPGIPADSADQRHAVTAAAERHVPVTIVHRGDVLTAGRLKVRVLWPVDGGRRGEDPNRRAVVLLVSYGTVDVLLTADAETEVTRSLRVGPVEVLKVAHHGSEDPGLGAQLRTLRPAVAVISVGAGNDYDHPRPETLAALDAAGGLSVYRTDLDGRVVVESDGGTVAVRSVGGTR
jgi:competence protein ComEC